MLPSVFFGELTRKEFGEAVAAGTVTAAIVPTGATEQHQDHLAMIHDTVSVTRGFQSMVPGSETMVWRHHPPALAPGPRLRARLLRGDLRRRHARGGPRRAPGAPADGMAVAYAVLGPDPAWGGRAWLLDLLVHTDFVACVADRLRGLRWPERPVHVCLDADAPARPALEAAGFAAMGRLPDLLGDGGAVDLFARG